MKDFLKIFPFRKFSVFVTIVGSFTYNILLNKDVTCNCEHRDRDCVCYLLLPWLVIFFLMLWTDKTFQRAWSYTCSCKSSCSTEGTTKKAGAKTKRCVFWGVFLSSCFKALLIGLLWVVSLFVEGDWYVCWSGELSCKDKTYLTAEDKKNITALKNESRFIGFSVLLGVLVLTALLSSCDWLSCSGDRDVVYYQLILKERENVMEDVLKEAVTDELKEIFIDKIRDKKLKQCFKAAEEIIKNSEEPKLSKEQEKLRDERMGGNRDVEQAEEEQPLRPQQ